MNDNGQFWPEQHAVDAWLTQYWPGCPANQAIKLKHAVSKYRISIHQELYKLQAKIFIDSLPWWKKDFRGEIIQTWGGESKFKSFRRIVKSNLAKLWRTS